MKLSAAQELGSETARRLWHGGKADAYALLQPVLASRTPFPILTRTGLSLAQADVTQAMLKDLMAHIAEEKTMGGWVVIGGILQHRLLANKKDALAQCRRYVMAADIWYGADILGERVPGPALVQDLDSTLQLQDPWRTDSNPWVRRVVGVGIHVWAKRTRGEKKHRPSVMRILDFLGPMFLEREIDAVKGIGWGIKTLGRHYPDLVAPWLAAQMEEKQRPRSVMIRKALTYLSDEHRAVALGP